MEPYLSQLHQHEEEYKKKKKKKKNSSRTWIQVNKYCVCIQKMRKTNFKNLKNDGFDDIHK